MIDGKRVKYTNWLFMLLLIFLDTSQTHIEFRVLYPRFAIIWDSLSQLRHFMDNEF